MRLRRLLRPIRQLFCKKDRFVIGPRYEWEDIKVGEVFGAEGCFGVFYKESDWSVILIDTDEKVAQPYLGTSLNLDVFYITLDDTRCYDLDFLYKLPKETQQLYYQPIEGFHKATVEE
jgi:hypothetical protein